MDTTSATILRNYHRKLSNWKAANEERKACYPQFGGRTCKCDDRGVPCLYDMFTYREACGEAPAHPDDLRAAALAKLS